MKKVVRKFPRSLQVIAMLMCVVLLMSTIGTGTAQAAPTYYSVSVAEKLQDIYWVDAPTAKEVEFAFKYKITNSYNFSYSKTLKVRTTWEEKVAGTNVYRKTDMVSGTNPVTKEYSVSRNSSTTDEKTLKVVSDIGLKDSKEGMIYRCKIELIDGGQVIQTIYTGEARLYYSAIVKFDKNTDNGSNEYASQEVKYGEKVSAPTAPTNGNQVFAGWCTDKNGENAFNFDTPITAPMTLYAKWAKNVTVTFHMNGHGSESQKPAQQTIPEGTTATEPTSIPTDEDYVFAGWATRSDSGYFSHYTYTDYDFSKPVNGNIDLYAQWTKKVVVRFTFSGRHGLQDIVQKIAPGTTAVEPETPVCVGYPETHIFVGWYSNAECTKPYVFSTKLYKDTTIYSLWHTHTPAVAVRENEKAPTCEEPGSYESVVYCSDKDCKEELSRQTITVLAKGHKPGATQFENEHAADCENAGSYDKVVYCTVCEKELSRETVTVPANKHKPGQPVIENEIAPDCENKGSYDIVKFCTDCGKEVFRETVEVPANGHQEGEISVENEIAPDCENKGSYDNVVYCTVCQKELSRETVKIPANGHKEGDTVVENVTVADCENKGSYENVVYCTVCQKELTRNKVVVNEKGHTPGDVVIENEVAPDCENTGSYDKVQYCTVCEKEVSRETITIPANGHTEGQIVVENEIPATCTEDGSYDNVVYCTVCGKELSRKTVTVEKSGHTAGVAKTENINEATCDEAGSYDSVVYCTKCGKELSRTTITVPATGNHIAGDAVVENQKAATCTEDGSYDTVVYCTDCKEEISRKTVTVPAIGHTEGKAVVENETAATCTENGSYDSVVYCTVCGEEVSRETIVLEKKGHTLGEATEEDRIDPTYESAGSYHKVIRCTVCGEVVSDETIEIEKLVPQVEEISISGLDKAKNQYNIDDELDVTGLEIVYKMSDGTEKRIPVTKDMVSGFDSSKAVVDQKLTVEYEGTIGTYLVTINDNRIPEYILEGDLIWDGVGDMNLTVHRTFDDQITFSLFEGLSENGETIDSANYDAASGSLKLKLHKDYLKSLGEGEHDILISFKDGSVTAAVKIQAQADPVEEDPDPKDPENGNTDKKDEKEPIDSPKTGDSAMYILWIGLLLLALATIAVAKCSKRRNARG